MLYVLKFWSSKTQGHNHRDDHHNLHNVMVMTKSHHQYDDCRYEYDDRHLSVLSVSLCYFIILILDVYHRHSMTSMSVTCQKSLKGQMAIHLK